MVRGCGGFFLEGRGGIDNLDKCLIGRLLWFKYCEIFYYYFRNNFVK